MGYALRVDALNHNRLMSTAARWLVQEATCRTQPRRGGTRPPELKSRRAGRSVRATPRKGRAGRLRRRPGTPGPPSEKAGASCRPPKALRWRRRWPSPAGSRGHLPKRPSRTGEVAGDRSDARSRAGSTAWSSRRCSSTSSASVRRPAGAARRARPRVGHGTPAAATRIRDLRLISPGWPPPRPRAGDESPVQRRQQARRLRDHGSRSGLNGYDIEAPEEEVVTVMLALATGEIDEERLASWLRSWLVPERRIRDRRAPRRGRRRGVMRRWVRLPLGPPWRTSSLPCDRRRPSRAASQGRPCAVSCRTHMMGLGGLRE